MKNENIPTDELDDAAFAKKIVNELRAKGTICGTGDQMDEIRAEYIKKTNERKSECRRKRMMEIWKSVRNRDI